MAKKLFTSNSRFRSEFYTLLHFICIDFCTTPKKFPLFLLAASTYFLQIFSVLAKSLFYPIFFSKNQVNDLFYYSKALQNLLALHAKPVARGLNLPHNMWVRNHVYENEKFLLLLKTLLLCLLEKCIHVISNKGSVALLEMPTVACNITQ